MVDRRPAPAGPAREAATFPDHRIRGDGQILFRALLVAVSLHLVALWVPLPARRTPLPVAEVTIERPEIVPWIPKTPEIQPPEIDSGPRPARRRPLPMRDSADVEPVHEPAVQPAPHTASLTDVVEFLPVAGAPPPAPTVRELGTPGLIPPVLEVRVEPAYPAMGRVARQGGRVVLRAVIDREGFVQDVEVLQAPVTDLGFSGAALEAVRRWRYAPGTIGGRPVPVSMTVVVDFTIR